MRNPAFFLQQHAERQPHGGLSRSVVLLSLAAVLVVVVVAINLIAQFDRAAQARELTMVRRGLEQHIGELHTSLLPYVGWDEAVANVDRHFNPGWVQDNQIIGTDRLGFRQVALLDAQDRLLLAEIDRRPQGPAVWRGWQPVLAPLLARLRREEATHPLPYRNGRLDREHNEQVATRAFVRLGGKPYLVDALLIRPYDGSTPLRGLRAPIMVAMMPADGFLLANMVRRYNIGAARIAPAASADFETASVALPGLDGRPVGFLSWHSIKPGLEVLGRLALPLVLITAIFGYIAAALARKSSRNAAELIASEARARHLAYHDMLTGLPNRAMMFDRLGQMLAMCQRYGHVSAVHCLDLDRFKEVNDTLGHPAGDELIRQVAARLVDLCRASDTVARLGGDEFVILQPETQAAGASHLAQRVLALFEQPFELEAGTVEVGCSIGVSLITPEVQESTEVLRQADMALYGSKEAGKNRVTFFEPEMDASLRMRRALEADLRRALLHGQLTMVYQPQFDIMGHVTAIEALVRWTHPEKGPISPAVFIHLCEETGLILELGEYVFDRVFAETRDWPGARVAVNVSPVQLRSPGFMAGLRRLVRAHGVDPRRYEIEITETALLGDDGPTRHNIVQLKADGFGIALDDFGTGYSNLSSLKRHAVDTIKIDRSFVQNLDANEEAEALVDAIVKLGRALRLNIVAEGVETETQRLLLISVGCTQFQGYLLGRPVPASQLPALNAAQAG